MNNLKNSRQVYLVTGYTDLRRSIDGLAAIVQAHPIYSLIHIVRHCFCSAADAVTVSKACFGRAMDFCFFTSGWTMESFNSSAMKQKPCGSLRKQTRWLMEGLKIEQPKAIREGKKGIVLTFLEKIIDFACFFWSFVV